MKRPDIIIGTAFIPFDTAKEAWVLPGGELTQSRNRARYVAGEMHKLMTKQTKVDLCQTKQ